MTIEEYFGDWSTVIDLSEADRILRSLPSDICPQKKDVFKAFRLCPLNKLRCVVVGLDPYPDLYNNKPRATGLAFANPSDVPETNYSPSLEVLRESVIDYTVPHGIINFDPSLEEWEAQGVLLLNAALSCKVGNTGSHALLWRPFIVSLISRLSECRPGIVYILMGAVAQSFEPYINQSSNYIIRIRHPSWYARQKTRMPSTIWQEANNVLTSLNGSGIEWFKEN